MDRSKPTVSTMAPASAAISMVSSIGNPCVSCSRKATSPDTRPLPVASSSSRMAEPEANVRRKLPSSRSTVAWMRSSSSVSTG